MKHLMKIIFTLLLFGAGASAFGQAMEGGAGVCAVSGDPDNITDMQTQDERYECMLAFDETNQVLYRYQGANSLGNRWVEIPLSTVTDTDTRLDFVDVSGGNVNFNIIEVHNGDNVVGTVTIPVIDIAPVQGVAAGSGISVSSTAGNYTVSSTVTGENTTVSDGNTVALTETGSDISGEVILDPAGSNILSSSASGLLATETDPVYSADPASGITSTNISNWNTAHSWGDHSTEGYLTTETDPIYSASIASNITATDTLNWTTAYGWGDHSTAGYLTSESDPIFSASIASNITATDTLNWDEAYSWGDHSTAGYLTSEVDGSTTNELQTLSSGSTASGGDFTLSDGGGTIGIDGTNGISVSITGGVFSVTNDQEAKGSYDNHSEAGTGGVSIGEYFYASSDNTMGATPGTLIRRAY